MQHIEMSENGGLFILSQKGDLAALFPLLECISLRVKVLSIR